MTCKGRVVPTGDEVVVLSLKDFKRMRAIEKEAGRLAAKVKRLTRKLLRHG